MAPYQKPLPDVTPEFLALIDEHGIAGAARMLHRRYAAVRAAAVAAGLPIRPGRRRSSDLKKRDDEIWNRYRETRESLAKLGKAYGLTSSRVAQIIALRRSQSLRPAE